MMFSITSDDDRAVRYVLAWWERHPQELAWLDEQDSRLELDTYRHELWDNVNAATEGDLARLCSRGSLEWVWIVGMSTVETLKERRRRG